MKLNKNGFTWLLWPFLFTTILILTTFFAANHISNSYKSNSQATVQSSKREISRAPNYLTANQAFDELKPVFNKYTSGTQKGCPSYELTEKYRYDASTGCLDGVLSKEKLIAIAHAYGVTQSNTYISIGLQKGIDLDITGLGETYIENKQHLGIDDHRWYWEIGACDTNNQLFIDAVDGTTAGLHKYTYCSKSEELSAPG